MRKTLHFRVSDSGRDNGKTFILTEMSAMKAEKWALKALLALMNSGVDVPENAKAMPTAALAELGLKALGGLSFEVAEPLLEEMLSCITFMPEPKTPHVIRPLFEEDIEEVQTLFKLRLEVLKLHVNFSMTDKSLNSLEEDPLSVNPIGSRITKTSIL